MLGFPRLISYGRLHFPCVRLFICDVIIASEQTRVTRQRDHRLQQEAGLGRQLVPLVRRRSERFDGHACMWTCVRQESDTRGSKFSACIPWVRLVKTDWLSCRAGGTISKYARVVSHGEAR